jgi:hypothetical protein
MKLILHRISQNHRVLCDIFGMLELFNRTIRVARVLGCGKLNSITCRHVRSSGGGMIKDAKRQLLPVDGQNRCKCCPPMLGSCRYGKRLPHGTRRA